MSDSHENARLAVGLEVSTTSITAVCLDESHQIVGEHQSDFVFSESASQQLIRFIEDLKVKFGKFDNIGVAVPALVSDGGSKVAFSSHIAEFSGMDLSTTITSATGVQALLENDANAAAYGEFHLGAGVGSRNMFYLTLGAGVGGSLILDGVLWRGASGYAGEFGYIPINSEGVRIEEVASSANIIRRARSRIHQDSTSSLVDLDESRLTISDIVAAAEAGDDFAKLMLERTGSYVGTGVAIIINVLNIEKIVIGGEIMGGKHAILDAIVARAREFSFAPSFESTEITAGKLGRNAAAIGAALLAANAK